MLSFLEKTLLKTETKEWYEETLEDGTRVIRVETKQEKWFPKDENQKHNPTCSTTVEYY